MDQYFSELLKTSLIVIIFMILIFIILYCIYYSKKRNYNFFGAFLEENKIYIEIFLVICLSFMSIMIATNANIIAENELKIQKVNNQPLFYFDDIRYGNGYYEKLIIYNYGAPLIKFSISPIVLIQIGDYKDNIYKEMKIELLNYYAISSRSGNDSRILEEFFGSDSEPLNGNFYTVGHFYETSRNDNLSWEGMTLYKYVNIDYEDIYGEKHKIYI